MAYNLDEVTGIGDNVAFIHDRRGEQRLGGRAEMGGTVTSIGWSRVLGEISAASVRLAVPGESHGPRATCCRSLGEIHTWAHTLVIYRSGVRVWEGPITRLTYGRDYVIVDASDVLGWLTKRVVSARNTGTTEVTVVNEGQNLMQRAFAADDPNVLPFLTVLNIGEGAKTVRAVIEAQGYYDEDLATLGSAGLRFTTVGRQTIMWPDTRFLGRTNALSPGEHLNADVEVIEDGTQAATKTIATNDTGEVGSFGTIDAYYGLLEHNLDLSQGHRTIAGLNNAAKADRNQRYPAPTLLRVPDDAELDPMAPFPMAQLVPGMLVPVESSATCRTLSTSMILSRVKVTDDADGSGEKVSITVIPVTGEATALAGT